MADAPRHPRIWLQPADTADEDTGPMWCQDKVWEGATEYVRADIPAAEIKRLECAVREAQFHPLGDNHHNALLCPHCNPEGLRFADPKQTPGAQP